MINIDAQIKEASNSLHLTRGKTSIKISETGKPTASQQDLTDLLNETNKVITIKPDSITIKLIIEKEPKEQSLESLLEAVAKKITKVTTENQLTTDECINRVKAYL